MHCSIPRLISCWILSSFNVDSRINFAFDMSCVFSRSDLNFNETSGNKLETTGDSFNQSLPILYSFMYFRIETV